MEPSELPNCHIEISMSGNIKEQEEGEGGREKGETRGEEVRRGGGETRGGETGRGERREERGDEGRGEREIREGVRGDRGECTRGVVCGESSMRG